MLTLKLYRAADPNEIVDTRAFSQASICIGRDPASDWAIDDEACAVSRRHCALTLSEGRLHITDTSANGTFIGAKRQRLTPNQTTHIKTDEPIHIGDFIIVVAEPLQPANDQSDLSLDAPFHAPILFEPDLTPAAYQVRSAWPEPPTPSSSGRLPDAVLLEAFCEGAGLDPSMFMTEDPAAVMRRAGAIYQQAVLGLSDLMGERTSLKHAYQMDRTTVGAADNNPFKWANAHRVAVDLLKAPRGPFLSGPEAVNHSFEDLKKHLLCLIAGSRAAVSEALSELAPERIEEHAETALFKGKADACWRAYQSHHKALSAGAHESHDGAISRAFKTGYERHVRKLTGLGTVS